MSRINTLNAKRTVAVFMAVVMMILSLSYTGNNQTDAANTTRKYCVYNAKTGAYKKRYTLKTVSPTNNTRSIIGDVDERELDYEKKGTIQLTMHNDEGSYTGSGFVVDSHTIATAAHCVCGEDITDILLFDKYGNITMHATPVEIHFPRKYLSQESLFYDYALVTVKEDLSSYTKFDLSVPLDSFVNSEVTVTGFPEIVKNKITNEDIIVNTYTEHNMYSGKGNILEQNDYLMSYDTDMSEGQSGGPVYTVESFDIGGNKRTCYTVVGINTSYPKYNPTFNMGIRITTDLLQFYKQNPNLQW